MPPKKTCKQKSRPWGRATLTVGFFVEKNLKKFVVTLDIERSGEYILGGEELTLNSKGESVISYKDYAIAMVDEILKGNNIGKRISVVRK